MRRLLCNQIGFPPAGRDASVISIFLPFPHPLSITAKTEHASRRIAPQVRPSSVHYRICSHFPRRRALLNHRFGQSSERSSCRRLPFIRREKTRHRPTSRDTIPVNNVEPTPTSVSGDNCRAVGMPRRFFASADTGLFKSFWRMYFKFTKLQKILRMMCNWYAM